MIAAGDLSLDLKFPQGSNSRLSFHFQCSATQYPARSARSDPHPSPLPPSTTLGLHHPLAGLPYVNVVF